MLKRLREIGVGSFSPIYPGARIVPLHIMLSGCGYSVERSPSYNWDGLKRGKSEFVIFQYTLSGRGVLEYEGKEFEVKEASAFFLHVPHKHRYYLPKDSEHWEFIYFSLVGREAISIWRRIETLNGPLVNLDAKTPLLRKLRDLYALGMRNQLGGVYHCSSLSYELLMLACDEFLPCSYIKNDVKFIPLVISFCVENIGKKISIDDMASVANLSRFHFGRLFKESQGVSPGIFLNNLRMKNALKLIQTEVLSVKEISEICGFEDSSYFCKVFKKCFGTSPEKYRRGKR